MPNVYFQRQDFNQCRTRAITRANTEQGKWTSFYTSFTFKQLFKIRVHAALELESEHIVSQLLLRALNANRVSFNGGDAGDSCKILEKLFITNFQSRALIAHCVPNMALRHFYRPRSEQISRTKFRSRPYRLFIKVLQHSPPPPPPRLTHGRDRPLCRSE